MATLTELLTQIEQHPKFIKLIDPNQDFGFYKFYTIYFKENNIIKSVSIAIYTDNRGTSTEAAYFKDDMPDILKVTTSTPQEILTSEVKTKIAEVMTADATIEKVNITLTTNEVIEGTAYKYNSATNSVSKINIVFYYDKNNALIWRKIV